MPLIFCSFVDFSQNSSFAAGHDSVIPLKPIDVMSERRTIQSCLAILFSSASVTRYQPWDTYIFPPEVVELVFLDVKACGGDVKAAASLNEKIDLARKHSHFVNLRFLQTENAVLTVLPSTPRMFDAEDVSFVDLEIKGISSLTINVFAIECAMFLPCFRELYFQSCGFNFVFCRFAEFCKTGVFEVTTSFSVGSLGSCCSVVFQSFMRSSRSRVCYLFGRNRFCLIICLTFSIAKLLGTKRILAAAHVTFLKFVFRFPQMKGRGVWLVDMIGSELIRSRVSRFSFALHF